MSNKSETEKQEREFDVMSAIAWLLVALVVVGLFYFIGQIFGVFA